VTNRFSHSNKTVLFYDSSHGNQIEYYDPSGRAFLWYPGNRVIVPGEWRVDGQDICFRYGMNTYNAVTGERGGTWSRSPLRQWTSDVVDSATGDAFGLATGEIPFHLRRHPRFGSIAEVKAEP